MSATIQQPTPWLSIGLTALAIVGTLLSVLLGSFLSRSTTHRQWVRDQRLKAYGDMSEAVSHFFRELDRAWESERKVPDQWVIAVAKVNDRLSEVYAAASVLVLVAPPRVTAVVDSMMHIIVERLIRATQKAERSNSEWEVIRADCLNEHQRMITAFRADLRVYTR